MNDKVVFLAFKNDNTQQEHISFSAVLHAKTRRSLWCMTEWNSR